MITISIDVTKVEKARLIEGKKGGKYLNLVLFETKTPDRYGNDILVRQQVSKEERAAGKELPILGSGKDWSKSGPRHDRPKQAAPAAAEEAPPDGEDDVPF